MEEEGGVVDGERETARSRVPAPGVALLVDADPSWSDEVVVLLEERGLCAERVLDRTHALRQVEGRAYGAVLLGLQSPVASSLGFLEEILKATPSQTVVVVAGITERESVLAALRRGAYDWVVVPPTPEEMDRVIRHWTERANLHAQNEELQRQALADDLTSAYNRRYMELYIDEELERSRRYGHPFSILFLDMDYLKAINDRYGHMSGSKALREVAHVIHSRLRGTDKVFRFGGDEFVVTLAETDQEGAYRVAVRLREAINAHRFLEEDGVGAQLTASFGIAAFPQDGKTKDELLRHADAAMYKVKESTRDGIGVEKGERG